LIMNCLISSVALAARPIRWRNRAYSAWALLKARTRSCPTRTTLSISLWPWVDNRKVIQLSSTFWLINAHLKRVFQLWGFANNS
jgi:hypothetical protein